MESPKDPDALVWGDFHLNDRRITYVAVAVLQTACLTLMMILIDKYSVLCRLCGEENNCGVAASVMKGQETRKKSPVLRYRRLRDVTSPDPDNPLVCKSRSAADNWLIACRWQKKKRNLSLLLNNGWTF